MKLRRLIVPALIPAAFLAGTFVNAGLATQQPASAPLVFEVGCMKVDPHKDAEYRNLEHDIWRPVHAERIRQGMMVSWTLYDVRYPSGTSKPCDYVTMNAHNSLADAQRDFAPIFARIHPNMPMAEVLKRTFDARDQVRGEVWLPVDRAP